MIRAFSSWRSIDQSWPTIYGSSRADAARRCCSHAEAAPRDTCSLWSASPGDLRSFALAADGFLAGFLDPREIFRVRTVNLYGVADAVAEAVRQDGVVDDSVPALSLGARE